MQAPLSNLVLMEMVALLFFEVVMRLLFIEDDPHTAATIIELLGEFTDLEFRLETKVAGLAELISAYRPEAVILDLQVEDSTVRNTVEQVIPEISDLVPVVVLTGYDSDTVRRSVENGAMLLVEKIEAISHPEQFLRDVKAAIICFPLRAKATACLARCNEVLSAYAFEIEHTGGMG